MSNLKINEALLKSLESRGEFHEQRRQNDLRNRELYEFRKKEDQQRTAEECSRSFNCMLMEVEERIRLAKEAEAAIESATREYEDAEEDVEEAIKMAKESFEIFKTAVDEAENKTNSEIIEMHKKRDQELEDTKKKLEKKESLLSLLGIPEEKQRRVIIKKLEQDDCDDAEKLEQPVQKKARVVVPDPDTNGVVIFRYPDYEMVFPMTSSSSQKTVKTIVFKFPEESPSDKNEQEDGEHEH